MKPKTLTPTQEFLLKTLIYAPEQLRAVLSTLKEPRRAMKFFYKIFPDRVGIEIDLQGMSKNVWGEMVKLESITKTRTDKGLVVNRNGAKAFGDTPVEHLVELKISFWSVTQFKSLKKILNMLENDSKTHLPKRGGLHIHCNCPGVYNSDILKNIVKDRLAKYFNFIVGDIFHKKKRKYVNSHEDVPFTKIAVARNHDTIEYRVGKPTFNYSVLAKQVICVGYITKQLRLNRPIDEPLLRAILAI